MTKLNSSTLRRLKKIKQSPNSVWEGDRRSLPRVREYEEGNNLIHLNQHDVDDEQPQCILWVDGSKGMVRSMDIVESTVGHEAFVRAFLQAVERPQDPAEPSRPQKILVCDRELQFYLRGVLQDLDITIDYVENLPLINDIFSNIIKHTSSSPPPIPAAQAAALYNQADLLWRNAPWEYMWDHEVVAIELKQWDIETLYAVVMGRLGLEQGVIFYRSQESLVQFRQRIVAEEREDDLEETFLRQDCLFALFESSESLPESELRRIRSYGWPATRDQIYPTFGMLHPLEGGRPYLYEEEALALTAALESFNLFLQQYSSTLKQGEFQLLQGQYSVHLPTGSSGKPKTSKITVKTLPELAEELQKFSEATDEDLEDSVINEDLWPDHTVFRFMSEGIPWERVAYLREHTPNCYLAANSFPQKGDGLAALLIQTSRPKALELIKQIDGFGGIQAICFNPAESFLGEKCELGLLIMENSDLHLFGEFDNDDREFEQMRKKWKQRCKSTKNICAVIIAMGVTGGSRGNPEPKHILGYYEIPLISAKELGLGTLSAQPLFGFDLDM